MSEIGVTVLHFLRVLLAVGLVGYLPGAMLVTWLFPPRSLRRIEHFTLSTIASLGLTALTAYALTHSHGGLTPQILAVWPLAFALIFLAAAGLRWHYRPRTSVAAQPRNRPPYRLPDLPDDLQSRLPRRRLGAALALTLVALLAFTVNNVSANRGLTEFYLAPQSYQATSVQYTQRDNNLILPVVVVNHENRATIYRFEAWLDGQPMRLSERPTLLAGERWTSELEIPLPVEHPSYLSANRIDLLLYMVPDATSDSNSGIGRDNSAGREGATLQAHAEQAAPIARLRLWLHDESTQERQ